MGGRNWTWILNAIEQTTEAHAFSTSPHAGWFTYYRQMWQLFFASFCTGQPQQMSFRPLVVSGS